MGDDRKDRYTRLRGIGLSDLEERVYRDLVSWGGGTQAEITASAGVPINRVRDALGSLETKGLVNRSTTRPARYMPTSPQSAIEVLIRARQEELEQARLAAGQLEEELRANAGGGETRQLVEVLAPGAGIGGLNHQLLASAGNEILGFQLPPLAPADDEFVALKLAILARGVSVRALYALKTLDSPGTMSFIETVAAAGEQSRVMADLPTQLLVVDRRIGFLPLRSERRGMTHEYLLVHPCSLLDSLVSLFENLWAQAAPFAPGTPGNAAADDEMLLSDQDSRLLALLAAGLQDQAVARQLGVGSRTVERRMRGIMDALGTETRFQAAVEATRRGWLGGTPQTGEPA